MIFTVNELDSLLGIQITAAMVLGTLLAVHVSVKIIIIKKENFDAKDSAGACDPILDKQV